MRRLTLILAGTLIAACGDQPRPAQPGERVSGNSAPATPARPPGTIIDSALPIAEHLRRFRAGLDSTDRLRGGSPTPQQLAARFLNAVSRQDTVDLLRMALSRPEFAWVYYPSHIYHDPPYELDPATFWTLIQGNSAKGLIRVLRRYGGRRLAYRHLRCSSSKSVGLPLRESERCELGFTVGGHAEVRQLFGSIIGDGRAFKFVSYANEF